MRVVAGEARGRRLTARLPAHVRPTTDLVREAVFSALVARGAVEGADVGDWYCGSGAMGIEALSRGARRCTFVDEDRRCLDAARANLDAVGLADRDATFVRAALPAWRPAGPLDLVLCDPPYGDDVDLAALLDGVTASLVVVESDRPLGVPEGWETPGPRRYGGTLVTMLAPTIEGVGS